MRISDWSSDVCSSDLSGLMRLFGLRAASRPSACRPCASTSAPDGARIAEIVLEDIGRGAGRAGRPGLDALLASRDVAPVTFRDWRRIEEAEVQAAIDGAPREKFTSVDAMLAALGR